MPNPLTASLDRLMLMPTTNAVIFVVAALSLIPLVWATLSAGVTTVRLYPPAIGRWAVVKPTDARARREWTRRGRQAWAILATWAAVIAFNLYLLWWCWTYVTVPLPEAGVAVHSLRLLSGLFLAWAFWPRRDERTR